MAKMMNEAEPFHVTTEVWLWRAQNPAITAAWHFLTVDGQTSAEIRFAALGRTGGFGSVKVIAQIGLTRWSTSLFPSREAGGYMLPLKASVRKAERIKAGDMVSVELLV